MINPVYSPDNERYSNGMKYRRCGKSGIMLPEISLPPEEAPLYQWVPRTG